MRPTRTAAALTAAALMAIAAPAFAAPASAGPSGFLAIADASVVGDQPELQTVRFEGQRGVRGAFGANIGGSRFDDGRRARPSGAFFSRGSRPSRGGGKSVLSIFGLDRGPAEPSRVSRPTTGSQDRIGR